MPAVERSRLQHQIEHVMQVFGDPARLRSRTLDLLEFYSSRVRAGSGDDRTGAIRSLGVPAAVMRSLELALAEAARADRHSGAMAAEALWTAPVMEARGLAIALLEVQPVEDLPAWIAAWSQTAEDPQLLERLAAGPIQAIYRSHRDGFWRAVGADLAGKGATPTVALLALREIVPVLHESDLPRLFEVLAAAPTPESGDAWRAYLDVVRAAAQRTPAETARHLVDEIERGRPGAARLARQTLGDFPPRQRDALRQTLRLGDGSSSPRPAGTGR